MAKRQDFSKLNGIWQGWYVYGSGYPEEQIGRREKFSMELRFTEQAVEGICHDRYSQLLYGAPAEIIGSYEPQVISFLKKYPCRMLVDLDDNYSMDTSQPSHEIQYHGFYNNGLLSRFRRFSGKWHIEESCVHPDGSLENYLMTGTWVMHKRKKFWGWRLAPEKIPGTGEFFPFGP